MERTVKSYRDLIAWQRARELVKEAYLLIPGCDFFKRQNVQKGPMDVTRKNRISRFVAFGAAYL